jgi:hypothetical protein
MRAAGLGLGAASVGALLWYGVAALTGYQLGIIAVVVGVLVGAAVKRGGGGRGGLPLQLLAMVLTYAAIATSYLPTLWKAAEGSETSVARLFVLACAVPFLDIGHHLIGLVLIGFALYEAWKINRAAVLRISGPYRVGGAVPPAQG